MDGNNTDKQTALLAYPCWFGEIGVIRVLAVAVAFCCCFLLCLLLFAFCRCRLLAELKPQHRFEIRQSPHEARVTQHARLHALTGEHGEIGHLFAEQQP